MTRNQEDEQESVCPERTAIKETDGEWVDPPPECPYNCPYDPMNPDRPEYADDVVESEIKAQRPDIRGVQSSNESVSDPDGSMTSIVRETGAEADVHFQNVWDTNWGKKVGVLSKPEFSDIFSEELEWEVSHHKWKSERVRDTEMWEVDAEAVFYVATEFMERDVDITIEDDVLEAYQSEVEP